MRLVTRPMVSSGANKVLETVTGVAAPNAAPTKGQLGLLNNPWAACSSISAPATMYPPIAVTNYNSVRRMLQFVNEGCVSPSQRREFPAFTL